MACLISAHAATTDDSTISPKENSVMRVTVPPNHSTSPYAVMMMVRFLKMVYTGMLRDCRALDPV